MGAADVSASDPVGAALLLAGTVSVLAGMYVACYTFFMANWEGWEAWNARTGLDEDPAEDERLRRLRTK